MIPNGWEWLIILAVLLLLFGAKKLPDMARSIGQSARVFKGEMKGMKADDQARAKEEATEVRPPALPPGGSTPVARPSVSTTEQPDGRSTGAQ